MIDAFQLRGLIQETLEEFESLGGPKATNEAKELLMMVAAHESHLGVYLKQNKGPALGIFQMEPNTFLDIKASYLAYRRDLDTSVSSFFVNGWDEGEVTWNLKAAIVMARVHFMRNPDVIPETMGDQARYAKKYWNTEKGEATPEEYMTDYKLRAL